LPDKEYMRQKIISHFGVPEGDNVHELILSACDKISVMNYNVNYARTNMDKALEENTGVCWHYIKSFKVLLEEVGFESESIYVYMNGRDTGHIISRIWDGDKWVYVDPTNYKAVSREYCNVNYLLVENSYIPFLNIGYVQ